MKFKRPQSMTWQGFVGLSPDADGNIARRQSFASTGFIFGDFA